MTRTELTCSPRYPDIGLLPSYFDALRAGLIIDTKNPSEGTPELIEQEIAAIQEEPEEFCKWMRAGKRAFLVDDEDRVVGIYQTSRRMDDMPADADTRDLGDFGWSIVPSEQGKGHGRTAVYGSVLGAVVNDLTEFYLTADGDDAADFIEHMFPISDLYDVDMIDEGSVYEVNRYFYKIHTVEAVKEFAKRYADGLGHQLMVDIAGIYNPNQDPLTVIKNILKEAA